MISKPFPRTTLTVTRLEDRTVPSAGSLDVSFGTGGFSTADFSNNDYGLAVALGDDGKIVVVGNADGQSNDFAIARFLPDGGLDPTFNGTGRLQPSMSSSHDYARDVLVLDDGKILVAGGGIFSRSYDFVLARFAADGTRDGTFGTNGVTTTNFDGSGRFGASEELASVMLRRPDGRILLIGDSNLSGYSSGPDAIAIAQYSQDGILDPNFGKVLTLASAVVQNGYQIQPSDAAIDATGGIVVVGSVKIGVDRPWQVFVVRYHADGTRDTSFGTVIFDRDITDYFSDSLRDQVEIQADGKILVAYIARIQSDSSMALARLNADGSRDATFGPGGLREYTDPAVWRVNAMSIQTDGKLVVGGKSSHGFVRRFEPNGDPDPTFGVNGFQDLRPGAYLDAVVDLAIRPDGKFVLAGSTAQLDGGHGYRDFGVMRLEGDTPSPALSPGITVVASGMTTVEGGGGSWLRIVLNSRPTSDVVLTFTVSDPTEGWTSVTSITFTSENWNVLQLVGVYSVDDTEADGNQPFTVDIAVSSDDPEYEDLDLASLTFTNLDNDAAPTKGKGGGKK